MTTTPETVRPMTTAAGARTAYRAGGVAALVAAAGYIAVPTLRAAVENGATTLDDFPTPEQIGQNLALGVFGFGVIGVATGIAALALTGLRPGTLASRLAAAAGSSCPRPGSASCQFMVAMTTVGRLRRRSCQLVVVVAAVCGLTTTMIWHQAERRAGQARISTIRWHGPLG